MQICGILPIYILEFFRNGAKNLHFTWSLDDSYVPQNLGISFQEPCAFYRPKRLSKSLKTTIVVVFSKVTKFGENKNSAYGKWEWTYQI